MKSDGSTAKYYELPRGCTELQDLIGHRNMNAQIGEIFRACYRFGQADHSDLLRDAKKIRFYAIAEVERLERDAAAFTTALDGPENESVESWRKRSLDEVVEHVGPQWADAPEWAQWLAQDQCGAWWWYDGKPYVREPALVYWQASSEWFGRASSGAKNPNWKSTLQKRPDVSNEWIDWAGGECPVADGTICQIMLRNRDQADTRTPEDWRWSAGGGSGSSDIIKYRLTEAPCLD